MKKLKKHVDLRGLGHDAWDREESGRVLDNLPNESFGTSMAAQRRRLRQLRQLEEERDARSKIDERSSDPSGFAQGETSRAQHDGRRAQQSKDPES